MGNGYYAPLEAPLLAHGCTRLRQGKGSHEIWLSPLDKRPFSVPVTIQSRHTANSILKQAGIAERL